MGCQLHGTKVLQSHGSPISLLLLRGHRAVGTSRFPRADALQRWRFWMQQLSCESLPSGFHQVSGAIVTNSFSPQTVAC